MRTGMHTAALCRQLTFVLCPSFTSVGHTLLTVNGQPVTNRKLPDGRSALEYLSKSENYPVSLTFAHQRAAVNERLMLLSMFHS